MLPMALDQACCVAISAARAPESPDAPTRLTIHNVEAAYPAAEFVLEPSSRLPEVAECTTWHKYVLAAMHGVWEHLSAAAAAAAAGAAAAVGASEVSAAASGCSSSIARGLGFRLMVNSTIPAGAFQWHVPLLSLLYVPLVSCLGEPLATCF